jgi:hypothetical protein
MSTDEHAAIVAALDTRDPARARAQVAAQRLRHAQSGGPLGGFKRLRLREVVWRAS